MSDDGTDGFVGVFLVLVAVVGIATQSGGPAPSGPTGGPTSAPTSSTAPRVTTSSTTTTAGGATSNIPGGPLFMCSGTVIEERTRTNSSGTLTVRVYYSASNGGRNCAVATTGGSAFSGPRGSIKINLHFTAYQGKRWPRFAHHTATNASRSGSVYLTNADNCCVVSTATFTPVTGGKQLKVTTGRTGCG